MDIRQVIRKILKEEVGKITTKDTDKAKELANAGVDVELTEGHGLDKDDIKYLKDFISDKKGDARLAKIIKFLIKSNIKVEKTKDLSKDKKEVDEGTCGYGIDGKIGNSPAGPKLRNK